MTRCPDQRQLAADTRARWQRSRTYLVLRTRRQSNRLRDETLFRTAQRLETTACVYGAVLRRGLPVDAGLLRKLAMGAHD